MLLFGGCSLDTLSALNEVDKVQLIKRSSYMKRYRAYFVRTHLKPIRRGEKYLFFYSAKRKDLAILLRPGRRYKLYSINHPHRVIATINTNRKTRLRHIYRTLARKGYHLTSPSSVGFSSRVRLRRYKGLKTLMVDVKDYRRLRGIYRKAIRNYDASSVKGIRTRLPKGMVASYLREYERKATTPEQKEQLRIIASKLRVRSNLPASNPAPSVSEKPKRNDAVYRYYRDQASYEELNAYLDGPEAGYTLTHKERKVLHARRSRLKEKRLLQEGSLEELIAAYKVNDDPRYKARIMTLMKQAQQSERSTVH
jgi:hypothetical protein